LGIGITGRDVTLRQIASLSPALVLGLIATGLLASAVVVARSIATHARPRADPESRHQVSDVLVRSS
jgi:hypothetical protein